MPYKSEWVDPEIMLEYHGITVFCIYDNDDFDAGPASYWFTLDPDDSQEGRADFDVREFDVPAVKRLNKGNGARPFLYLSGEPFDSMDEIGKAYAMATWDAYAAREPATIRQALREAIDAGLLDELHANIM